MFYSLVFFKADSDVFWTFYVLNVSVFFRNININYNKK